MNISREAFLQSPAAPAPDGVYPDFENPGNTYSRVWPAFMAVLILSNLVFFANTYVQLRVTKKFLVENYILIAAWAVYAFGFATVGALICHLPVGMHQWEMTKDKLMRHMFLYNVAFIFYGLLNMLIKVNILLQYVRIFVPHGVRNFTFWASHGLIGLNVIFYTIWVFLNLFICQPRKAFWDPTVEGGRCMDWTVILTTGNAVTIVSDAAIWLLPQRVIYSLQLTRPRKIALSLLFTIGIFACLCSGIRLYYLILLNKDKSDIPFIVSKVCLWGTCQLTAGFFVACLPTMPLFVNHIKKRSWAVRVGSTVRSLLRTTGVSRSEPSQVSNERVTISGGNTRKKVGKKCVTDIEFEELVQKTDMNGSMASISQPEQVTPATSQGAIRYEG